MSFSKCINMILVLTEIFIKVGYCDTTVHSRAISMPTLDIYKTKQLAGVSVQNLYGREIKKLSEILYSKSNLYCEQNRNQFILLTDKIIDDIKKRGQFAYTGLTIIRYPGETQPHFTIDVVDLADKQRMIEFLPPPSKNIADVDHLIKNWLEYENIGFSIFYHDNKPPSFYNCPAHHCLFGFDDKRLCKYADIFNHLVPKNKNTLLKILREDKNPKKRAAAAYLLAHIEDSRELIQWLLPSIFDSNSVVRNNTMRVIGATLAKDKYIDFPMDVLFKALDFPDTKDRNKALYILSTLVEREQYANDVKRHGLDLLLEELKLLQPDLHDLAYLILKKLSGKAYADRDYRSWQQWADSTKY